MALSPIWSNFELVQVFMVFLVTCQNEKDPIKNEGTRVFTLYINFSDAQGQITRDLGGILPKIELIQVFMHVLVTYKIEDDSIKNEGAVVTAFFPL